MVVDAHQMPRARTRINAKPEFDLDFDKAMSGVKRSVRASAGNVSPTPTASPTTAPHLHPAGGF